MVAMAGIAKIMPIIRSLWLRDTRYKLARSIPLSSNLYCDRLGFYRDQHCCSRDFQCPRLAFAYIDVGLRRRLSGNGIAVLVVRSASYQDRRVFNRYREPGITEDCGHRTISKSDYRTVCTNSASMIVMSTSSERGKRLAFPLLVLGLSTIVGR